MNGSCHVLNTYFCLLKFSCSATMVFYLLLLLDGAHACFHITACYALVSNLGLV